MVGGNGFSLYLCIMTKYDRNGEEMFGKAFVYEREERIQNAINIRCFNSLLCFLKCCIILCKSTENMKENDKQMWNKTEIILRYDENE